LNLQFFSNFCNCFPKSFYTKIFSDLFYHCSTLLKTWTLVLSRISNWKPTALLLSYRRRDYTTERW
jgi:hypothetical protein